MFRDGPINEPDWSPPISPPTPAPVRERRAGQRWSFDFDGRHPGSIHTLTSKRSDCWLATDKNGRESCFASEREFAELPHMFRFVSDAPATSEPGRAETDHVCGNGCAVCDPPAARPAQEAAKASVCADCGDGGHVAAGCPGPKCGNSGCKTPRQNVAQRYSPCFDGNGVKVGVALEWSCEPCHLLDEEEFAEKMMFEVTGEPYEGPERLPRHRLTHSAMWADWAEDI